MCLGGFTLSMFSSVNAADPKNWLGFRGDGTSASPSAPAEIKVGDDGNVAWKVAMPGKSVAGPIVVGDRVISTSSGGQEGEKLFVTAVSLKTGEKLWEQSFRATGRPFCHPTSANAAPSPVSDGERIFAFYSSNDLVCYPLKVICCGIAVSALITRKQVMTLAWHPRPSFPRVRLSLKSKPKGIRLQSVSMQLPVSISGEWLTATIELELAR